MQGPVGINGRRLPPRGSRGLSRDPRRRGTSWTVALGLWIAVFLLVWVLVKPEQPTPLHDPEAKPRTVTPRGDLTPEELATMRVFREASPSVLYIISSDLGRDFFSFDVFEIPRGAGSGFIYDHDGHIVTNFHVIGTGSRWTVTLADESRWEAQLVGFEADKDLAVLKIDAPAERMKPIVVGTSKDLQVGQTVLAIGNPFGFDQTLTVGVVSALGREIQSVTGRKIHGVIQTDAAINPGNSGGPLLDSAGRLIGVNTQIASPSGASAGVGFAVPVDIVNDTVPDLIRYGRVVRPGLGVVLFQEWQTRRLGIRGVLIDSVREGGAAARAGLRGTVVDSQGFIRQLGDIIVAVDDKEVKTMNELKDILELHKVGDEVRVKYTRQDKVESAVIKLEYLN